MGWAWLIPPASNCSPTSGSDSCSCSPGTSSDPRLLREQAGKLAMAGWALSAVIAVAAVAVLGSAGFVRDFVPVGLALHDDGAGHAAAYPA